MTIEQGKEINALYLGYKKTIDSLPQELTKSSKKPLRKKKG